jgi:hypothetical protein
VANLRESQRLKRRAKLIGRPRREAIGQTRVSSRYDGDKFELKKIGAMDRASGYERIDGERIEGERIDGERIEAERLERGGSTGAGKTATRAVPASPEEPSSHDSRPSNRGIMARLLSGSFSSASGREGTLGEQLLYTSTQQGGGEEDVRVRRGTPFGEVAREGGAEGRETGDRGDPGAPGTRGDPGARGDPVDPVDPSELGGLPGAQRSIYQEPGVAYLTLVSGGNVTDQQRINNGRGSNANRARSRARSRRWSLYRNVAMMVAYAAVIALVVFALTPRKVELGTVAVVPDGMRWSREEEVYTLRLNVTLPTYNPNFLPYEVKGDLRVMYYDAQAGNASIPARTVGLRERAATQVVVDASRLDQRYVLSVLSQCSLFPHVLTFFLEGEVWARRRFLSALAPWWQEYTLVSELETWFSVNCGV